MKFNKLPQRKRAVKYVKDGKILTSKEAGKYIAKKNMSAVEAIAKQEASLLMEIQKKRDKIVKRWKVLEKSGQSTRTTDISLKNKYDAVPDMILTSLLSDEVEAQQKFIDWAKDDFKGFVRDVLKYLPVTKVFAGQIKKTEKKTISFSEGLSQIGEALEAEPEVMEKIEQEIIDV